MATFISYANMKGGVGKTTMALLMADYLHSVLGKSVCLLDIDFRQKTISRRREKEKAAFILQADEKLKSEGKTLTPALKIKLENKFEETVFGVIAKPAEELAKINLDNLSKAYDYIIIDFPGTLDAPGIMNFYRLIDVLFVVTSPEDFDVDSTSIYIEEYNAKIKPIRDKVHMQTAMYGLANKVKKNTMEYKKFPEVKKALAIPFLDNEMPVMTELTRITTFSLNFKEFAKGNVLQDICEEMFEIIETIKK